MDRVSIPYPYRTDTSRARVRVRAIVRALSLYLYLYLRLYICKFWFLILNISTANLSLEGGGAVAEKTCKAPGEAKRGKKLEVEEPGVLYGRYSSHNQKDISVEQQFEKGYELAAEYGIRIIDTYADRAVSGRTDKRRDFQRMMTDAAKGKFRYVIAWKSNRMGRNMLEALINEARLQDLAFAFSMWRRISTILRLDASPPAR